MARVIAMLREARAAGLEIHREGDALIVRGAEDLDGVARNLLSHKPLVLAALRHEEECRGHERAEHLDEPVDWRVVADGALVCCVCHPAAGQGDEPDERPPATGMGHAAEEPACSMCGSGGRCQGRLAMPDGGWVCLAAVADGVVRIAGRRPAPGGPREPEAER